MIVPDSTNPYFAELTDGIAQAAAAARGYALLTAVQHRRTAARQAFPGVCGKPKDCRELRSFGGVASPRTTRIIGSVAPLLFITVGGTVVVSGIGAF